MEWYIQYCVPKKKANPKSKPALNDAGAEEFVSPHRKGMSTNQARKKRPVLGKANERAKPERSEMTYSDAALPRFSPKLDMHSPLII
jgi:hypothetical protein